MNAEPLRVLIVDDSRIFRGVLEDALSERVDLRVVGSVWSGEKAVEFSRSLLPDFVTLDIEMPGMGGIETLKMLRDLSAARQRQIGILLVSSHTRRGDAITIKGLEEGAFDFITKPDGPDARENSNALREQLFSRIDAFQSRRVKETAAQPPPLRAQSSRGAARFRAVVIGSSTGGPAALKQLLPILTPRCPVPIFLVQHLPADFTRYFASSLTGWCGTRIIEAAEGTPVEPGILYVAQGGQHLILNKKNGRIVTGLSDAPPENGCRPAADVLFRSASVMYGADVLGVVLTGMGNDGAKGAAVLKRGGAHIIAQDEATSVVWGMPGSVVAAGVADEILPLGEIGSAIRSHLGIGD